MLKNLIGKARWCVLATCAIAYVSLTPTAAADYQRGAGRPPFDPGRVGFSITVDDVTSDYRIFSLFAMPGERVVVKTSVQTRAHARGGDTLPVEGGHVWVAPQEPGLYVLDLMSDSDVMRVNAFVLRPATDIRNERLEGYRIGSYAEPRVTGRAQYPRPEGFVEVTEENQDTFVSPHFRLSQFLCHQASDYPKFLIVKPALLAKLERVLEEVNKAGHRTDGFVVMSGYRTPWYNRAIGNETDYSRHLQGDAADIFIDEDGDRYIDDLNNDGVSSLEDAQVLYDIVQGLSEEPWWGPYQGGLGEYSPNRVRGAFIHVDARGLPVRWGRVW